MSLLLDLGNTRLKWARHGDGRLLQANARPWSQLGGNAPEDLIAAARSGGNRVLAASVAGAAREKQVCKILTGHGLAAPVWVRTPAAACGVSNAYRQPDKLGVDRFLAMVAALHRGLAPCVVASVGTALTLDALAANGRHLGGLIAPGPSLMQEALHRAAANLPLPHDETLIDDMATDTVSAIFSGCWHAALGMVERFHARVRARLDGADTVVLVSGGDAPVLAEHLQVPATVQHDLVLHGLAVWDMQQPSGD